MQAVTLTSKCFRSADQSQFSAVSVFSLTGFHPIGQKLSSRFFHHGTTTH